MTKEVKKMYMAEVSAYLAVFLLWISSDTGLALLIVLTCG